jgi:hypothetical protein
MLGLVRLVVEDGSVIAGRMKEGALRRKCSPEARKTGI